MADPTPPTIPVTVTNAPVNWPAVLLAIGHMLWPVLIGGALLVVKMGGYTVTGPTTSTSTPGAPPDLTTVLIGGAAFHPDKADPLEWLPMQTADGGVIMVRGHWYPSHDGQPRGVVAYQEDNPKIPNLRALIEGQP